MIRSMTGFGKASRNLAGDLVTVEVNTVNHRFLDCVMHLPGSWAALEAVLKELVRKQVTRGRLNVWVIRKRGNGSARPVRFDRDTAQHYVAAARELSLLLGKKETLSVDALAQLEGVFYQEDPEEDLDKAAPVVAAALEEALLALNAMRATEGAALAEDLKHRLALLLRSLETVKTRLPEVNAHYEARLRTRLNELKVDLQIAEERLAVELALMADKGDVTEEVVRLKAHIDHALGLIEKDEPVGRDLNFLVQEMQREVNTLSAKVRDGDVSREVLGMKAELERFREQTQNIE